MKKQYAVAQLDHFYSKNIFPMFALCFYNLIPSCSACNHIKRDSAVDIVSPYFKNAFDDFHISWTINTHASNPHQSAGYQSSSEDLFMQADLEKKIEIKFPSESRYAGNIDVFKLESLYDFQKDYAAELITKIQCYSNPEMQKLITGVFTDHGIEELDVLRYYLGNYVNVNKDDTYNDLLKRPLAKMSQDFFDEFN